jgi:hypothetical protein
MTCPFWMLLSRCVQHLISEIWHYSKVTYVEGGTEDVSSYTLHGLCCSAGYDCPYHRGCQDIHRRDIDRDICATRANCDSRPWILPKVCLTMKYSMELIGLLLDPPIELRADGAATESLSHRSSDHWPLHTLIKRRIMEMQIFLHELVGKFTFTVPEGHSISPHMRGTLVPMTPDGRKCAYLHVTRMT